MRMGSGNLEWLSVEQEEVNDNPPPPTKKKIRFFNEEMILHFVTQLPRKHAREVNTVGMRKKKLLWNHLKVYLDMIGNTKQ